MKALVMIRLGVSDFLSLFLAILYLFAGTATSMLSWEAYHNLSLSILAGFFWPVGLAWMTLDHSLCHGLVSATFGFLAR